LLVIARLVRATHENRMAQKARRERRCEQSAAEIMGGPDKPGHDEEILGSDGAAGR